MPLKKPVEQARDWLELFGRIAGLWCGMLAVATVGRLLWLGMLREYLPEEAGWRDYAVVMFQGSRQDVVVNTYWVTPLLIAALVASLWPRTRRVFEGMLPATAFGFAAVTPFLLLLSVGNYAELQEGFSALTFEFFSGNHVEVLTTAWEEHSLLSQIALWIGLSAVCFLALRACDPGRLRLGERLAAFPAWRIYALAVLSAVLLPVGYRGSLGRRPVGDTDAGVTNHRFLCVAVMNPAFSLKYALRDYLAARTHSDHNRFLAAEAIPQALVSLSRIQGSTTAEPTADAAAHPLWRRTAAGAPNGPPEHVFVLFMESYDSWPFKERYAGLNLVPYGKQLAREGLALMRFLPGDNQSVGSVNVCVQGLFETSRVAQCCSPTSLVYLFHKLGYTTRHVAGFSSEQGSAGRYAEQQGFDEIYFSADIVPGGETPTYTVFDETLFRFVKDRLSYRRPTFTFVRTITNHTPWHVDLEAEGCRYDSLPPELAEEDHRELEDLLPAMGHLKYSDRAMGEFVRSMSERFPRALFVITGDHYGRHSFAREPNVFDRSAVPLILYGPEVIKGLRFPEDAVGGHIDLGATLAELCAPAGFPYMAMGRNLLAPHAEPFGVGNGCVMFPDSVVSLRTPLECEALPAEFAATRLEPDDAPRRIEGAQKLHQYYHGLGYEMAAQFLEDSKAVRAASTQRPAAIAH